MIEYGINNDVVVVGCSSDVCNQIQVWSSVIKLTGLSLKLLIDLVHLSVACSPVLVLLTHNIPRVKVMLNG